MNGTLTLYGLKKKGKGMGMTRGQRLKRGLLSILFPERCACCGRVVPPLSGCCESCHGELAIILPPVCSCCGANREDCVCRKHRRHFDRCAVPFYYEGPVKQGILRLKEQDDVDNAEFFARYMAQVVRREYGSLRFDWIIPVPLTRARRKERGFNQSERLARALSRELTVPVSTALCKVAETRPQKELTALERSGNLLGAFEVEGADLEGARILLTDDLITTGSTLDECAKMLKLYGASEVCVVTAARTRFKKI